MTKWLRGFAAALVLIPITGCGQTFGSMLYYMSPKQRVPARFQLTEGRLLVLVDDDQEVSTWPPACSVLTDEIAKHLETAKACGPVIAGPEIARMRRTDSEFERLSISDMAARFRANQVLWVRLEEFIATQNFEQISAAAQMVVRIKVFDPQATSKAKMRLFPGSRDGEFLSVAKAAHDLTQYDEDHAIARLLVEDMAEQIAELFYKHTVEE